MSKLRIAILASTNATSSQGLLDAVASGEVNAEVVCFIVNKKDCGAVERARRHHIPVVFIDSQGKTREAFDAEVMSVLDEQRVDLVLLIGYMRILSAPFVKQWGKKTLNIHPSLLPAFAGGMDKNVHEEVLKAGVAETGCTLHFISEKADEGPIVAQRTVAVSPNDTVETLKKKVQQQESDVIVAAVRAWPIAL